MTSKLSAAELDIIKKLRFPIYEPKVEKNNALLLFAAEDKKWARENGWDPKMNLLSTKTNGLETAVCRPSDEVQRNCSLHENKILHRTSNRPYHSAAVFEKEPVEETSEEEIPASRSSRCRSTQNETEEPKEKKEQQMETVGDQPIYRKKKRSELDGLLSLQNAIQFDVNGKKESRDERKARELYERTQKENAAALENTEYNKKTPMRTRRTTSDVLKSPSTTPKQETEKKGTPSGRNTSSKNKVKEETPKRNKRSLSPTIMSAPKKMFLHRYNQQIAAEKEEPVSKRAKKTE